MQARWSIIVSRSSMPSSITAKMPASMPFCLNAWPTVGTMSAYDPSVIRQCRNAEGSAFDTGSVATRTFNAGRAMVLACAAGQSGGRHRTRHFRPRSLRRPRRGRAPASHVKSRASLTSVTVNLAGQLADLPYPPQMSRSFIERSMPRLEGIGSHAAKAVGRQQSRHRGVVAQQRDSGRGCPSTPLFDFVVHGCADKVVSSKAHIRGHLHRRINDRSLYHAR